MLKWKTADVMFDLYVWVFAGVFGSVVLSGHLSVTASPEQGDSVNKPPREPPPGVYGHAFITGRVDSDDSTEPEEVLIYSN